MIATLMVSAKLATLGFLKIKVFWNKGYDVINSAYEITIKVLSVDLNYSVDFATWPKFGNSSISMKEVIIAPILSGFYQKNYFLEDALGSSLIIWNWL